MGVPAFNLKLAMAFLARRMDGFWPVMAAKSLAAASTSLTSWVPSPTPILTTIFSSRGACIGLLYPNFLMRAGFTSFWYFSFNLAIIILFSVF